jgi:hypothetical protein
MLKPPRRDYEKSVVGDAKPSAGGCSVARSETIDIDTGGDYLYSGRVNAVVVHNELGKRL